MGDPAGVGPEVIVKAFNGNQVRQLCRALVIGDARVLRAAAERFAPGLALRSIRNVGKASFSAGEMDVIDCGNVPESLPRARPSAEGGKAAVEFIHRAADLACGQQVEAIVTAPINKEAIHLAGFPYPGHTELLADYTQTPNVALMMAGDRLRVVLATTHVPVRDISSLLNQDQIVKTISLTHRWLVQYVTETPRIAVTGLNPHCGDGGIFGKEESDIIVPAIQTAQAEGIQVTGPYPADSLFSRFDPNRYDAVIAMYHDQGLIPVKMAGRGQAVNITLGLPILRTSVDHGTAYDIAGKGIASEESLIEALKMAARLAQSSLALK